MSSRPRRALVGLLTALAACVALPTTALAAGETLTVSPSSTQAGSNPNITATVTFSPSDTPRAMVVSLPPGLLANLNANPSCLVATQLTSACQIGTATITTITGGASAVDTPGGLYLVPPQNAGDGTGIAFVPPAGSAFPNQYIGVSLNPAAAGALNLTTTFVAPPADTRVTQFQATINSTLNNHAFTRLPSSCGPATSKVSVTYYGATPAGSASSSFTPTGCTSLPYAPNLTLAVAKDKADSGAALVSTVNQAPNEAASKSITLGLPKGLTPNLQADLACLNATGCKVGTAVATSPLVPSAALANGSLTLAEQGSTPTLSISFPAPFALTITGTVSLTSNSLTFAGVPDIPLTSLTLNISGPAGKNAFNTDCTPANITGGFTAQSGAVHSVSAPIAYSGCPGKPTALGSSTGGLASGHPRLTFKVTRGKGAAKISSVAVAVPRGLRFSRGAFVSSKTCTVLHQKKKCTTTTKILGLGVAGGTAKSVTLRRGRLVITLQKATSSVRLTVTEPLVTEAKSLQRPVKQHKTKRLTFTLRVTDAGHTLTTVPVSLRAH